MAARGKAYLGLVTIIVESYDTAIDYFTRKLGFVVAEDSPATKTVSGEAKRWVVIQRPDHAKVETSILLAQAHGPEQCATIGKQWAGRVGMFLYVEDFDAEFDRLREAGVEFLEEPKQESFRKFAVFHDICGNKWDLIQPASQSG